MTTVRMALAVAAASAAALFASAFFFPRLAAAGWLLAFSYMAALPLGSLALLLVHRLTGGRWGEALEPFLRPLSLVTPLLVILAVPALAATSLLFPWAQKSVTGLTPSVQAVYLNVPSYIVRALIALGGLSICAIFLPESADRRAPLRAGLMLLFYGVAVSFTGLDWLLVPDAPFFSTSFGASVAFTQLLAALACAAAIAPREQKLPDLGALMLVVTLGITYTDFMAVLVMWYGDLPSKVFWFAERVQEPWQIVAVASFILASAVPTAFLMFARVRRSRAALRPIAVSSLIGLALYQTWLLAPAFGVGAAGTAILALIAMASLIVAFVGAGWPQRIGLRRQGAAHG